jgi:hypothetical protein
VERRTTSASPQCFGGHWDRPSDRKAQDAHTITTGAFEAFVTFARLHGVTLRMVTGAGKMAKTKKTARELAAMVMREVRASGKCSDLQNRSNIDRMQYAGSNLDKARQIFNEAIGHRPRIRLTIQRGLFSQDFNCCNPASWLRLLVVLLGPSDKRRVIHFRMSA